MVILWLDPWTWSWQSIYFMAASNIYVVIFFPFAHVFCIPYAIFSTVTGYFRLYCMLMGLVGTEKTKTWKVTIKVGGPLTGPHALKPSTRTLSATQQTKSRDLADFD